MTAAVEEWAKQGKTLEQGVREIIAKVVGEALVADAKQQTAREDILEILEVRFGIVPETVTDILEKNANADDLKKLHREAITISSIDAFLQLIETKH